MRAGFPHSEICGSAPICRLPAAYRRLSRPSSPVIAKASTTCTYSLDPITLPPPLLDPAPTSRGPGGDASQSRSRHRAAIGNSRACASTSRDVNTMQYITQCPSTRAVITTTLPTNNYLLSQIVKEQPIDAVLKKKHQSTSHPRDADCCFLVPASVSCHLLPAA